MKLVEAISAVMDSVGAVGKDGWNEQQRFKFRGVDAVRNAVSPALRAHGVVIMPVPGGGAPTYEEFQSNRGTRMAHCKMTRHYKVTGPEGDFEIVEAHAEATDAADKATAKASSVAYRTMLLELLCLPTDEPDPDSEYVERGAPVSAAALLRQKIMDECTMRGMGKEDLRELFMATDGYTAGAKFVDCEDTAVLGTLYAKITEAAA